MNTANFSRSLIILRGRKGWTQKELADKLSVSVRSVIAWEKGASKPHVSKLIKIAQVFGLDDEYFFKNEVSSSDDEIIKSLEQKIFEDERYRDISDREKYEFLADVSFLLNKKGFTK